MHLQKNILIIAVLLQIVWGLVPSASRLVISEIPVELYITIRWTISGLIFFSFILYKSQCPTLLKRETIWVIILGIFGYAIGSFGTLYGLKIGGVTNFALLGALNPVITTLAAVGILNEKPRRIFYIALLLCVSGLMLLVFGKHQISSWKVAISSSSLVIGASFLEAIIFMFSKKFKVHFSSAHYLAISQLSAAVFMWGTQLLFFHQLSAIRNLTTNGWIAAIFVSVVACVLCYSILYWLINYIEGHRLALFDGVHTLSASFFGFLLFREILNTPMIFGGILLLTGLVIGNFNLDKK